MQQSSFSKTSILTEDYLTQKRKALGGLAGALQVTLLGAVDSAQPDKRPPSLLYAVTWSKRNDKIENVSQIAAAILSNSRRIFLGAVLKLMTALDWHRTQFTYFDTDSALISHSRPLLADCVYEENREKNLALLASVLESSDDPREQSGLFKFEGASGINVFCLARGLNLGLNGGR